MSLDQTREDLIVLNAVLYNPAAGVLTTAAGLAISGSAPSYAWATKPAAAAGNKNKYIVITDLIETGGVATLFQSDGVSTWWQQTIPRTTFAKANASTNLKGTAGLRVLCTDIGLTGRYIELASDGTNLNPTHPQLLFNARYGTITTPTLIASTPGTNQITLPSVPTFQAGLFHLDSKIEVRAKTTRTGAATATLLTYIGTQGSSADSKVSDSSQPAANTSCTHVPKVEFTSSSTFITTSSSIDGGNGVAGAFIDRNTNINTGAVMYLSAYATLTNPDTLNLQSLEIWWRA